MDPNMKLCEKWYKCEVCTSKYVAQVLYFGLEFAHIANPIEMKLQRHDSSTQSIVLVANNVPLSTKELLKSSQKEVKKFGSKVDKLEPDWASSDNLVCIGHVQCSAQSAVQLATLKNSLGARQL